MPLGKFFWPHRWFQMGQDIGDSALYGFNTLLSIFMGLGFKAPARRGGVSVKKQSAMVQDPVPALGLRIAGKFHPINQKIVSAR